jgi:subtilisin family serine protease
MASVRAATAAAVASLAAVAVAAWFAVPGGNSAGRFAVCDGATPVPAAATAWQVATTKFDQIPSSLLAGTSPAEIAVVDTGADLTALPLTGRPVVTFDVLSRSRAVTDVNGHGTFVASLAAETDAPLLIVKAAGPDGSFTAAAEARAIRYAVDHGARVLNLSFAGTSTSALERSAIKYAIRRGVLVVAAAGNEYASGNPVEFPAALLQPVGSRGKGGAGLVVGASTRDGHRAAFSNAGSWISLAAPGDAVVGMLAGTTPAKTVAGTLGLGSGTSYAAPQVAAAAALVWGIDPTLTARQVADILKGTASSAAAWTPELGYGVLDIAAAVAKAQALTAPSTTPSA